MVVVREAFGHTSKVYVATFDTTVTVIGSFPHRVQRFAIETIRSVS